MRRTKGFTLIELLIVIAIISIITAIIINVYRWHISGRPAWGWQPTVTCLNGFVYTVDRYGSAVQQFNEQGGAVSCITR